MNKCKKQIADFQLNILGNAYKSANMDKDFQKRTITYLTEELGELDVAFSNKDKHEQADALIDLIYFALGTCYQLGVDFDGAFTAVHEANMNKKRGVKAERGLDGDASKPESWTAPDLTPFL